MSVGSANNADTSSMKGGSATPTINDLYVAASGGGKGSKFGGTSDLAVPIQQIYQTAANTGSTPHGNATADIETTTAATDAAFYSQLFPGLSQQQIITEMQSIAGTPLAQKIQTAALANDNAIFNPDTLADKIFGGLSLAGAIAGVGLLTGGVLAPALASAAGVTGASLGGAGVAGSVGTGIGAIGASAGAGAVGGAFDSALQGQNIGIGALEGGVGAGLGAAAKPLTGSLQSAGLDPITSNALVKGGIGATTGALGAGLSGGNVGQAALTGGVSGAVRGAISGSGITQGNNPLTNVGASALTGAVAGQLTGQGAVSGAINSATGAVAGSIFNSGNTIFSSGDASQPTTDSSLTNPASPVQIPPGNIFMGDGEDDPFDYDIPSDTDPGIFGGDYDTSSGLSAADLAALQQIDPGLLGDLNLPTAAQEAGSVNIGGINGATNNTSVGLPKLGGNGTTAGNGSAATSSSSNPLTSLLSALGIGGSSSNSALLSQLLGLGASAAGGALNSAAAQGAAGTYGTQTAYNPYSVTTNNGTTTFNGTNATSTLSPDQQATAAGLNNLGTSALTSLAAGPDAATKQYYDQLQAEQADANNKYFQNNLDSQFANGVLGSTAGQYQSQAALNNISQQQLADQAAATANSNTIQQQQLANLTASLNGSNNLTAAQLQQLQTAGNLGSAASGANAVAYKPSLVANANSTFGGILSGLGNGTTNNTQSLLASLGSNGTAPSDKALKTDIRPIARLPNGLTAYAFKYIWDKKTTHVGYIAQEVRSLYPDAVNDDKGYLEVNYAKVA